MELLIEKGYKIIVYYYEIVDTKALLKRVFDRAEYEYAKNGYYRILSPHDVLERLKEIRHHVDTYIIPSYLNGTFYKVFIIPNG